MLTNKTYKVTKQNPILLENSIFMARVSPEDSFFVYINKLLVGDYTSTWSGSQTMWLSEIEEMTNEME